MMLNTPRGVQSSAILYSIAETAQTNKLKPYEYFQLLLDEIAEHLYASRRLRVLVLVFVGLNLGTEIMLGVFILLFMSVITLSQKGSEEIHGTT